MEKNQIKLNKIKGEKGSITLFVLIAMLFFLIVVIGIYIANKNNQQAQIREIESIAEKYSNSANINQIYQEAFDEMYLDITFEPNGKEYEAAEDADYATATTKIKIGSKAGSVTDLKYGWSESKEIQPTTWTPFNKTTDGTIVTEKIEIGGMRYLWVQAKKDNGEIAKVVSNKFTVKDTRGPQIELNPDGGTIKIKTDTTTIAVTTKITDETGVGEVKYVWTTSNSQKPDESLWTILGEGQTTITSPEYGEGTYYLWIEGTDTLGNKTEFISKEFIVKETAKPEVTMKYNTASGEKYADGTWTNQDIYTEVTLPDDEGTVEKYEYSFDLVNWKDVSEIPAVEKIDYTTTFPYVDGKPDWLGDITPNGTYYFDIDENGKLTSAGEHGNKGIHNMTANSYIPIDLSKYSEDDKLTVTLNYTISSEKNYDFGYATITEETIAPEYNSSTEDRFVYESGEQKTETKIKEISGGKIYYLHLGYRKDISGNNGDDNFIINSLTLTSESLGKAINFNEYQKQNNKVIFKISQDIVTDIYFRASFVENGKSKISDKVTVKMDKTAPIATAEYDYTSRDKAQITISNIIDKDSGLRGYYISSEQVTPTAESNWTETTEETININDLLINKTYYIWLIDNANNISEPITCQVEDANYKIDNDKYATTLEKAIEKAEENSTITLLKDFEDSSTATINKNVTLDIQNYTLARTQVITINSNATVEVIGEGTITSSTNNHTISNSGTLTINMKGRVENTAESSNYSAIYNTKSLTVTQGTISGVYKGIYTNNSNATLNINGGSIFATKETSSSYAIYGYGSMNIDECIIQGYTGIYRNGSSGNTIINAGIIKGTGAHGLCAYGNTTINGGQIEGKTNGIYQSSGTLNLLDGTIKGDKGICQSSSATVNIYGGKIEGKTYGIYGNGTDKITIGNIDEEVDSVKPSIYGASYGVYMEKDEYGFKFNKGIIVSETETTTYKGILNPREEYVNYTYYDYDTKRKWCTVLAQSVSEITFSHSPEGFTNQNIKVKVQYPTSSTRQYSEDKENWIDVTQNVYETYVSENKIVYARTLDESGIIIEEKQYEINTIDKIVPTVEVTTEKTKYVITNHEDKVNIQYSIVATDEGVSGIKEAKYAWVKEGEEPSDYIDIENGITITQSSLSEGNYYLYLKVTDNAGNESETNQIRFNVTFQEPVAQIGENKYATIQEAIESCSKEAGETQTTITILKSTDEESTTYEGQNIILDLQGYTVGSSNANQATFTNNGTLTIIDTSDTKAGTIENLVGTAIVNNGTLTIGDNNTPIEDEKPIISGKKVGIKNNNTLNYYDGTIKGKAAIDGKVQGTPEEYGAVGIYENGITIVNLRVVSDYVARIEWTYYTTLQSAFDACESKTNNTTQTTVVMIKDIVLQDTAKVYNGQNIRLDLNGHALTNTNNTVLDNTGILEMSDLTTEAIGKIMSSVEGTFNSYYRLITNNGHLLLTSGNITTEYNYNYSIYNENGIVDIQGGEVISKININDSTTNVYSIYNYGKGIINMKGGTVNSDISNNSNKYTNAYGIYNNAEGTINIIEGVVCVGISGRGTTYGIYDNATGTININGGTVNSISSSDQCTTYGIYNNGKGTINVTGGMINSNSIGYFSQNDGSAIGICNNREGTINVTGGMINSNGSSSSSYGHTYGIINKAGGIINITGGKVIGSSDHKDRSAYGIANKAGGIINVAGGTVSGTGSNSNTYGISNDKEGTINVTKGTVSSSNTGEGVYNKAYGIINKESGTIKITGGEVNGSCKYYAYGIYNTSNGTNAYGMYNNIWGGTIILGTNDDGNMSGDSPVIKATSSGTSNTKPGIGIYNMAGDVYFYDGVIKETLQYGTKGITDVEEGYQIKEEYIDEYSNVYLEPKVEENVVINENTKEQYSDIKDAINKAKDNEETKLRLLRDFELKTSFEVNKTKNINLDLAGKTITNDFIKIKNKGTLTINDSIGQGGISNEKNGLAIVNKGELFIKGGIIKSSSSSAVAYGIYNTGDGTVKLQGGEIRSESIYSGVYWTNETAYGIHNSGTVNIQGGKVNLTGRNCSGIYNSNKGTIEVIEGEINVNGSSQSAGIRNAGEGTVKISGGNINNDSRGDVTGISNLSIGKIEMSGGRVNCNSNSSQRVDAIYNTSSGTIEVTGGELNCSSTGLTYGIYNSSNSGQVTLGTKGDGIVSNTIPNIKATYTGTSTSNGSYGIYNTNGSLYFYDGRIEGSTLAVYTGSLITEWEENTQLKYENEDKILTLSTEAMDIAKIGETTYTTLEEAILAAGTNETTIELLRGIQYSNKETTIKIGENQNITIDLKGYTISSAIEEAVFTNKGSLKIVDTTKEQKGKIISGFEKVINNEGTLDLSNVTISQIKSLGYPVYNMSGATLNLTNGQLIGGEKSLYNLGNAVINGTTVEEEIINTDNANLKVTSGTITKITNKENARLEITGGEIKDKYLSNSRNAISNTSTNEVSITGGTIYGIDSTAGTINIGTKDGSIIAEPVIIGIGNVIYGINSNCELNFYDGVIKGKEVAIQGTISDIEDRSELILGEEVIGETTYKTLTVSKIDTATARANETEYDSLKEAIGAISDTGTVTILRTGTISENIEIPDNKNITIDLNGNTITTYNQFINKGTLKITDTSTENAGILKGHKEGSIDNRGNVEIISGKISGSTYGIYNNQNGTATITGGTISENTYGIYNANGGTVNVTNGNIAQNTYGIYNYSGTTSVTGGSIVQNTYGIYNAGGITNISGGTINTNENGIYNTTGTINITELTITGNTKEVINGGKGTINIGTQDGVVDKEHPVIQGETYAIENSGNGTIGFYDGIIKGKIGAISGYYLYTESGYTVNTEVIEGYNCDTLVLSGTVSTVAKIGEIEYTNLQSAINACTSEEATTITLVNGVNTNGTFIVEEGQNVIIDLNGKQYHQAQ